MINNDQDAVYRSCVTTLADIVDGGARMRAVERAIEALPVSGEEQSALWLWVIASRDRPLHDERDSVIGAPSLREMLTALLQAVLPKPRGLAPSRDGTELTCP